MPSETRAAVGTKGGRYARRADEELVSLAGEGDAGAFTALHDRHSRAAYSLSFRMMGERQAAEDLTQEAFLKAWRSAGSYRAHRGSVRTWLLSIVGNAGVDRLRSSATRSRTRDRLKAEAPRLQPSEAFPEAWRNHLGERVRVALRDVPLAQREVLSLVHLSGLTQAEASERLGVPLGTVKGRIRLGLKKLRDHPELRGMGFG
jgi:RNA polymerase sigma-70 factor (ECF subfamily)